MAPKASNNGQKLAIAGAATLVAEPALALAHTGGIGVIVGLAAGAFTYWLADEVEQMMSQQTMSTDGENSPSDAAETNPTTTKTKESSPSLLYRMFNGKSVRSLDSNETQDDESGQQQERPQAREPRTVGKYTLQLASDYNPHINEVLGRCILGVGQRGTGKSNLAARLIEQIGQYPIPMFIGDYKQDYITLPEVLERCVIGGAHDWEHQSECQTYWKITRENAQRAGALLMAKGIQLAFQCLSYETLDEAAEIMTQIIKGMFAWALKQDPGQRVPALVVLDEAQQFLPQNQGDSRVNPAISSQLFQAFEKLNSVGRSLGFTPAFFTQRIAQIRKEVIGGSELFFLMRQTLPQDLKVYEDLIGKDEKGKNRLDRRIVTALRQGEGIIYENGEFFTTHFDERESSHLSTTPDLEDALTYYQRGNSSLALDEETEEAEALRGNNAARRRNSAVSERPVNTPPVQDQQLQMTIYKLLSLYEEGKIDEETFQRLFDAIPGSSSGQFDAEQQEAPTPSSAQSSTRESSQQPPIDLELERAIEAFREGATSINKLAAALDIKPYYAGPLLERVKKEVQKRQVVNG